MNFNCKWIAKRTLEIAEVACEIIIAAVRRKRKREVKCKKCPRFGKGWGIKVLIEYSSSNIGKSSTRKKDGSDFGRKNQFKRFKATIVQCEHWQKNLEAAKEIF